MGPQVYSHRHSAFVNSFHLADDKWPMSVVNMWQLNELQVTSMSLPLRTSSCSVCLSLVLRSAHEQAAEIVFLGTLGKWGVASKAFDCVIVEMGAIQFRPV